MKSPLFLLRSFVRSLTGATTPLKVNGFHTSSTGVGYPKENLQELDAHDIPFTAKTADGSLFDAIQIARARVNAGKENIHTIVYRKSVDSSGYDPNLPDYNKTPRDAAVEHWEWHKAHFPQEVKDNKDLVWVETINEPNKDSDEVVEWLGLFAQETAVLALQDGYKWLAFGWSGGTPEPYHWELPGMLDYLRLCSEHPDRLGVALHEYSWVIDDIWNGREGTAGNYTYSLIGRFTELVKVCDNHKIGRPTIVMTEWGWSEHDVPDPTTAVSHIKEVGELYAKYECVKGAAIWYLGSGYQDIAQKAQKLIGPVQMAVLNTFYPPPDPPPDPEPDKTLEQFIWYIGLELAPTNDEAALQRFINGDPPWKPYGRETWRKYSGDGETYAIQPAINWEAIGGERPRRTYYCKVPDWGNIFYVDDPETEPPPEPQNPLDGLKIAPPFSDYFVLTSAFNDPRDYNEDGVYDEKHEGADYDLVGEPSDSKKPVLCGFPGEVVFAGTRGTAYGYYTIIKCQHNLSPFYLWYCHMDRVYVNVGDWVNVEDELGELGGTGGDWPEHVHINLQVPGFGLSGYVVPEVVDPAPYIEMIPKPSEPVYSGPPTSMFVRSVDQPASDWYWYNGRAVFDKTGLTPKFHTTGDSHQWYTQYKGSGFNLLRNRDDLMGDYWGSVINFYNMGLRDVEAWNEPNIEQEGLGSLWNDGYEFGQVLKSFCQKIKGQLPDIRIWFPGCSPGFGSQYAFIDAAVSAGGLDLCYGICEHVYTGITDNVEAAVSQMFNEVMEFRSKYALTRPLVISEFSVNRPALASYKAQVYKLFYERLEGVEGVQMAVSFTSTWHPNSDPNQEGWLEFGIHDAYAAL